MNLKVPVRILRTLGKGDDAKHPHFTDLFSSWKSDSDLVSIDTNSISSEELEDIENVMKTDTVQLDGYSALSRRLSSYRSLMKSGSSKTIKRLLDIPDSFKAFAKEFMPSNLIYVQDDMGVNNPYIVTDCEYHERYRDCPPYVSFTFKATRQGEDQTKSFSIHTEDLRRKDEEGGTGKSIAEILSDNNVLIENMDLNMDHAISLDKYRDLLNEKGRVYTGSKYGMATMEYIDRWGDKRNGKRKFYFKDNVSPKVVIDFNGVYDDSSGSDKREDDKVIYSSFIGKRVKLPIHTYGDVFHLEDHHWISIHVDYLNEYQFAGKELMDKLVLSKQDKELIKILMEMSKMKIDDIVEGKSGGSFIMATGIPGTGKTLTAEVFSETIEKPLYKVQCSQLGLDVDSVEKNLKTVLSRASRWGAILLIDEADVYVRARGTDINQNAIVGTFLRTLEYYTGILFMTSNMGTAIDDAIMSRATAHLEYGSPDLEAREKIWEILSEQLDIELTIGDQRALAEHFETAVGRDIKALLKLSKMYCEGKKIECTPEVIKSISGFVPNVNRNVN